MTAPDRTRPPAPGPIRPYHFPGVDRRRLPDGLAVLSARQGELPLVTARLVFDAGAAAEPGGRAGLARLTAHGLETGTAGRSGAELAWELEHLGIELETDARWDAAVLSLTVPRERLEPALALLAEIARRPSFPVAEVERLRAQQLARILQRRKDPGALAADVFGRFVYAPPSPYARPLHGFAETVEALDRDAVVAYHEARFRPAGSALVLTGAVKPDEAEELAGRYFGDWAGAAPPAVELPAEPAVEGTTVFVVDRPDAVQSELRIGHVGVPRRHPDHFPLVVANAILGGMFTSRLNMSLRERHGFTYGAHSHFAFRRGPGPFVVDTAVATEVTAPAVEEILRQLNLLRDEGPEDAEVAAARDYLQGVFPLRLQTTDQLAAALADLVTYGLPDDHFDRYRERVAAVTPADVVRAARDHIHPDRLAVVVVGDAGRVVAPLEALGIGPVEVHAA